MTRIGYHASHEQFPPRELLDLTRLAERHGFGSAMCSDHFAPWSTRQGHSGAAWPWLGATLATTSVPVGVVTSPVGRYHPAVVAQQAATLADCFPGRFWLALGSGQALNEHITGDPWPAKEVRTRRLAEAVAVIRALFAGETVTHHGLFQVDRATLWSRPAQPPPLYGAAVTPGTARQVAGWADGLITINQPDEGQRETLTAYRDAGGVGPAVLQVHLSLADSYDEALAAAEDQWREPVLGSDVGWELALPAHFEQAASFIAAQQLPGYVVVADASATVVDWLRRQVASGFDQLMLHHVGRDQAAFVATAAEEIVPALQG